jgi:hypothetical protein
MTTDEKILNALEALKTDVTTMKSEIGKIPAVEKQLSQQGKILTVITANVGTILEEQQAQRIDIRSFHTELHASKDELKAEILSARAEAKADSVDLKATAMKRLKDHEKRIDALEENAGIPHPDKN